MTRTITTGLLFLFLTASGSSFGQDSDIIKISFINAKFTDPKSPADVFVAFLVMTRDSADFPPQINIPPQCTAFENGQEKVVLLSPHNLAVALYGEDIALKSPEAYDLVKGHIDLKSMAPGLIITFKLTDIPYTFTKMSMTPAFTEKRDKEKRVAKRFEFTVN